MLIPNFKTKLRSNLKSGLLKYVQSEFQIQSYDTPRKTLVLNLPFRNYILRKPLQFDCSKF
jgi:hypothetical protein